MEGADMTSLTGVLEILRPLAFGYSVAALGYLVAKLALHGNKDKKETYIVSDDRGNRIEVTLDPAAPAEERARVLSEKLRALSAPT
jgi:hypothetical protein